MAKKPDLTVPALEAPNAGELDVYSVLWAERRDEDRPLQLSEVYRRVCERRRSFGEPEPALTTIATHLRRLTGKRLIEELAALRRPAGEQPPVRVRGGYTPPTRSPLTSYRSLHTPGDVLYSTFCGLGAAYPPQERLQALIDLRTAQESRPTCVPWLPR
jgi:hypothetical protein